MLPFIAILKAANVWEGRKGGANLSPPYQIKRTRSQVEPKGCGSECRGYPLLQQIRYRLRSTYTSYRGRIETEANVDTGLKAQGW